MDGYRLTLDDTISPDDLACLIHGIDLACVEREGEAFTCAFSFSWSPLTWVGRIVRYFDGDLFLRTELWRRDGAGAISKEPFDDWELFGNVREATFSLVSAAHALERLYQERDASGDAFGWIPDRISYVDDAHHRLDLTKAYPHRFRMAARRDWARALPRTGEPFAWASDEGDICLLHLRRGRYASGGLAIELVDEGVSHRGWLTADAGFGREHDPFVCLDTRRLGKDIASWVERQNMGEPTGDALQIEAGFRYPVFRMREDFVRMLDAADPFIAS